MIRAFDYEDDIEEDVAELGPCCLCEKEGPDVRNIVTFHREAPEAGKGWGCFECHLPMNGAVAVLCDDCLEKRKGDDDQYAGKIVAGYPGEGKRIGAADYPFIAFNHDWKWHESEEDAPENYD